MVTIITGDFRSARSQGERIGVQLNDGSESLF